MAQGNGRGTVNERVDAWEKEWQPGSAQGEWRQVRENEPEQGKGTGAAPGRAVGAGTAKKYEAEAECELELSCEW